jgi:molecular chaperone Hsp33
MSADGDPFANLDHVLAFTLPGRHARGRLVRLGPVLDTILANHQYPPILARLLAEALVLTALLGSTLKEMDDQLTIQAHSQSGVVDLLVCDYRAGALRGYLRHDPDKLAQAPATPSLFGLFGKGYLAITFDQAANNERYQGIVPLEGGSLAEAAESYFSQSEQIPSLVRLAVVDHGIAGHIAGGIMIQHLPEGEEGRERLHTRLDHPEWEHVAALAGTLSEGELVDPELELGAVLWRLFHEEEIRVLPEAALARGCRCSAAHIRDVITRFPPEERAGMAEADGVIRVDCAFCARVFPVPLDSLGR